MKGIEQTPGEERVLAPLAATAHELKSPLTLVHHLACTLASVELQLTEQERTQHLERLQLTSERMLRLVQQIAMSYRLSDERQLAFRFQLEPLSAAEVCHSVAQELTPYARAHGQHLQVVSQHCPHLVLANRDILHDVVTNLADNAIRHNPRGGSILLQASCRGDRVRLSVTDEGGGVLPHELATLRRTLGEQPQPLSGRSSTSGLGLYIASQFARAMGGQLGLGRAPVGARFFVDLMRSQQLSLL